MEALLQFLERAAALVPTLETLGASTLDLFNRAKDIAKRGVVATEDWAYLDSLEAQQDAALDTPVPGENEGADLQAVQEQQSMSTGASKRSSKPVAVQQNTPPSGTSGGEVRDADVGNDPKPS